MDGSGRITGWRDRDLFFITPLRAMLGRRWGFVFPWMP